MRKSKLAIRDCGPSTGACGRRLSFCARFPEPATRAYHPPGNTSRVDNTGARMVGRAALPLAGGVLNGNEKVERVEHDNFQDAKAGKQNAD